jgi:UDP-N-acetylmuramate dehydrogenase
MTTFRTGGPADWFLETSEAADVARAMVASQQLGLPVTFLGGGSNVLVGGRGVRGLVIRLRHGGIRETHGGCVRVDAGVSLNGLVRWMVSRGWSGLERWAGTPGTVGGAIHGNAHFQGHLIGNQISRVGLIDASGAAFEVESHDMQFGYDTSRLQHGGEAALWADFDVSPGVPAALREAARESLAYRKSTQPLASRSAGCIFQNPNRTSYDVPDDIPASAGALIDRAGLKGTSMGKARVSTVHGNFIVSDGSATPREICDLIELCRTTVQDEFGVRLRDEIRYLGEF